MKNKLTLETSTQTARTAPQWQPRIPWERAPMDARENAGKLRTALLPDLRRIDGEHRSQVEIEAGGVARYQKAFGHAISGRWFRQLLKRTVERDRGARDWMRLEIYLADEHWREIVAAPGSSRCIGKPK